MTNNSNQKNDNNKTINFEEKAKNTFLLLSRLLMPPAIAIYAFYFYSLNSEYDKIASFLLRFVSPLLIFPVISSFLFLCLLEIKNGIASKSLLFGKINRQPFTFLGIVLFSFFALLCALILAWIIYIYFFNLYY